VAPVGKLVYRRYLDPSQTTGALFVSDTAGTHEIQITKPAKGEIDGDPDWSPDGKQIVFAKTLAAGSSHEVHAVAIVNADGSGLRTLTAGIPAQDTVIPGFDDFPVFSPDGRRIAYEEARGTANDVGIQHSTIRIMKTDGTGSRLLLAFPAFTSGVGGLAWSPDGKQILYGLINSAAETPANGRSFFTVNIDGTDNRQLGSDWTSGDDGNPSWSAAGNTIVFRVASDEESGFGNYFRISPDGTGLRQITHYSNTLVSHKVTISPDGQWIAYGVANKNGVIHIAIAKIGGSAVSVLRPDTLDTSAPDWSPVAAG
jgi:Tol biopolymer transport system component